MRRFRVKGVDIKSGEPVEFDAFEAADRNDVITRLAKASIDATRVEEVVVPLPVEPAEPRLVVHAPDPSLKAQLDELQARHDAAVAAWQSRDAAPSPPRVEVMPMQLTGWGFSQVMLAVALGILLSGIIGFLLMMLLAGGLGFLAGALAALGRSSGAGGGAGSGGGPISAPSAIEVLILLLLAGALLLPAGWWLIQKKR